MSNVHYLPGRLEYVSRHSASREEAESDVYVPGREWSGPMTLPVSAIVDWDAMDSVAPGDLVLVTDFGLTRSALVIEIIDEQTVQVDVA